MVFMISKPCQLRGGHICSKVEPRYLRRTVCSAPETENNHSLNGAGMKSYKAVKGGRSIPSFSASGSANSRQEPGRCFPKVNGSNLFELAPAVARHHVDPFLPCCVSLQPKQSMTPPVRSDILKKYLLYVALAAQGDFGAFSPTTTFIFMS